MPLATATKSPARKRLALETGIWIYSAAQLTDVEEFLTPEIMV
jgi:hypothetical protein